MKKLPLLFLLLLVYASCTKISDSENDSFFNSQGVFILNEGNFTWGNGSLSFYSYDSSKVYNNLFADINGRPLGDVPNSMVINGDKAYIIVNNSGKIEVINKNTIESVATIDGLISPRNMAIVNNDKAYVTSIYSNMLTIIDLSDNSISGYIDMRRTSEAIVIHGNKAFISNWVGGNEIMVINTLNNEVVDSIAVGVEPESVIIDKNNMLWVLCNGGWARENYAKLLAINTVTYSIEKQFIFPTKEASPTCLQIDGAGETIYYIENGVRKMDIEAPSLPDTPLIPESGHYFYKLGINPHNSDIFVTDAVDYQNKGFLLYYSKDGTFISTLEADIIPGLMCFSSNDNFQAE